LKSYVMSGLGRKRLLSDWYQFAGIDFEDPQTAENCSRKEIGKKIYQPV